MAKFTLKNSLAASRTDENGLQWYECATYTEVKEYMSSNIERTKGFYFKIKETFVEMGYWLKYIQENKMYEQDGFKNIWDFAQTNYDMSESTALRLMQINTEFSVDGNTPVIDERYKDYSKSQLQEILYLTSEQREEVSPDMTISEIREIKKKNQPDDGTIRTFAQEMLRGKIEKKDYADKKSLKDYLYNEFGKSHSGVYSDELEYSSDPKGITFNPLSPTPDDKITWSALAKRIIELYKNDPFTLELPEVLDDQMEIVNVDMEVKEYNSRQDALSESKEELQCEKVKSETEEVVKEQERIQAPENTEEEQEPVPPQESVCNEENKKPSVENTEQEDETDVDVEPFDEEVLSILSYTRGNVTDSIPFMNEDDMFIFGDGQKCALTMKLQKYIAAQINLLDLDKYRVEIRAVKIK